MAETREEVTSSSGEGALESEPTSTSVERGQGYGLTSTSGEVKPGSEEVEVILESEETSGEDKFGTEVSSATVEVRLGSDGEVGVSSSSGDVRPGSGSSSSSAYLVMLIILGLYGLKTIPVIRCVI